MVTMRSATHCRKGKQLLSVLLAGVLQFMPLLKAVIPLEARGLPAASWAWILKIGGGAVALLGSYDSVSGATQIVPPYTVNATVGKPYNRTLTTSGQTAMSWSANTAPLKSAVFPLTPGLWLTNRTGRIGGTPTWAGTSNIWIAAWELTGNAGAATSNRFVITITNPPPISISAAFLDSSNPAAPQFVIRFSSTPGKLYTVLYSDDNLASWKTAAGSVAAQSSTTLWADPGPPVTDARPLAAPRRFYRVSTSP